MSKKELMFDGFHAGLVIKAEVLLNSESALLGNTI